MVFFSFVLCNIVRMPTNSKICIIKEQPFGQTTATMKTEKKYFFSILKLKLKKNRKQQTEIHIKFYFIGFQVFLLPCYLTVRFGLSSDLLTLIKACVSGNRIWTFL